MSIDIRLSVSFVYSLDIASWFRECFLGILLIVGRLVCIFPCLSLFGFLLF